MRWEKQLAWSMIDRLRNSNKFVLIWGHVQLWFTTQISISSIMNICATPNLFKAIFALSEYPSYHIPNISLWPIFVQTCFDISFNSLWYNYILWIWEFQIHPFISKITWKQKYWLIETNSNGVLSWFDWQNNASFQENVSEASTWLSAKIINARIYIAIK